MTTLPAENDADENSRIGSIGAVARRSYAMNATTAAAPPISVPATIGLVHPSSEAWISPHTSDNAAAAPSTSPGTSMRAGLPSPSATLDRTNGIAPSASGTLIQKIHCQDRPSVTAPPMTGPSTTASPVTLP